MSARPAPAPGVGGRPGPAGADERGALRAAFSGLTTRGRSFLAAGAAATACAYLLGQPDLQRVGILLAALPLVCVLALYATRCRVTAARRLSPPRVAVGGEAQVHLRVENVFRMPSGLLLLQDTVPYTLGQRPRFVLDRIEPGGRREVSYRVHCDRRGRYALGPLQLRLADPFGMVELGRSFGASDVLTVLPRIDPLPTVRLGADAGGHGEGWRRTAAPTGDDDVIPRDYRHGDDLRRVHWRSTAHRGALMVRREEQSHRASCTVVLDTRRCAYTSTGRDSAFERAVSGAASVVAHMAGRGAAVRLVTDTGTVLPGPHAHHAAESSARIMDALAAVGYSAGTGLEGLEAAAVRGAGDGLLVAFLGAVDEAQVAVASRLRQRASSAVAFVAAGQLDPELESARRRALRATGWTTVAHHRGVPLGRLWEQASLDVTAGR